MAKEVKFAFVRATQGSNIKDNLYLKHIENLDRLNIPWSPYHLYNYMQNVDKQLFSFFLTATQDFKLQPVMDLELFDFWKPFPTKAGAIYVMRKFLTEMKINWPDRKPLLYTNPKFLKEVLNYDVPEDILELADLWVANWGATQPQIKPWKNWKYWQYAGDVSGVSYSKNGFDFDYFNGDILPIEEDTKILTLEDRVLRIEQVLNLV